MLPSTLKYLYSVKPVGRRFHAKQLSATDSECIPAFKTKRNLVTKGLNTASVVTVVIVCRVQLSVYFSYLLICAFSMERLFMLFIRKRLFVVFQIYIYSVLKLNK
jgi:hypothetical protein